MQQQQAKAKDRIGGFRPPTYSYELVHVPVSLACVRTYLIYVRYVCSLNPALPGGREIRVNVHSAYMHIDLNAKDEMRIR